MTSASSPRAFEVRHVQLARAAFAALAAVMITFSPDHSAEVGLSVFSGFSVATALIWFLAVWLVYPAGRRWPAIALGAVALLAGMAAAIAQLRTVTGFFAIVIAWAIISGAIETIASVRALRAGPKPLKAGEIAPWTDGRALAPAPRSESRDGLVVGLITVVLALALLCVPTGYALRYTIEDAHQTFTLTGITIAVGIFGAYAAIVAVYLAIAGLSPRQPNPAATTPGAAAQASLTEQGSDTEPALADPADPKDSA